MRGKAGRGRKSAPSTVTIPVQATSVGAISANQFTGWTHSAGTVSSQTAYGVTAKYFAFPHSTVDVQTRAVSRDHEVVFWGSRDRVYIRLVDGKALRFESNVSNGSWSVIYCTIGTSGYESDTLITSLGSGSAPSGWNGSDTDGDEWTFGATGFDVYVKWNGVEQWREKQIFSHKPGRVGLRTETGSFGFRTVSVNFLASVTLNSSPEFGVLDVRDFGCKSITTTGTMTAASTTLTVASNPGFEIGDPIIVETGGETGVGLRGTRGVGGQWPALTYANATAMNADTSQVSNKVCALLDTGVTYQWNGSAWVDYASTGYFDVMIPRALITTITNISGTTFTLADAAVVNTTNANVYYNSAVKLYEVVTPYYFGLWNHITDKTIEFPAGDFAWGVYNTTEYGLGGNRIRWSVRGQGVNSTRLFSPNGTQSLALGCEGWTGPSTIHDLELEGNFRALSHGHSYYDATTDVPTQAVPDILRVSLSDSVEVYNIKTVDHAAGAIILSYTNNSNVHDCEIVHTTGQRAYFSWAFNFANCTASTAENITINADYFIPGIEMFQSTNCTFTTVTGRNFFAALNSSGGWNMRGVSVTLETGACDQSYFDWHSNFSPIININSNIDNQQGVEGQTDTGVFSDFTIIQEDNFRSGVVFSAINISGTANYITIRGQYPSKPNSLGLVRVPAHASGLFAAKCVNDDNATRIVTIDGIRAITPNSTGPDIRLSSVNAIVRNCVADTITNAGTSTGNITNAAYNAL